MRKRIRTVWQRTPKSIREAVEESNKLIDDLIADKDQLRADNRNLLVQRDSAQHALTLLAGVEKIDTVITPDPRKAGLVRFFTVTDYGEIIPIFATLPGDKILITRKKIL